MRADDLPEEVVRRAFRHFMHDAEYPCSASAMREAIGVALWHEEKALRGMGQTVLLVSEREDIDAEDRAVLSKIGRDLLAMARGPQ